MSSNSLTDFSPDPKWHRIIKRPSCAIVFRKFAASAAFVSISFGGDFKSIAILRLL